MHAESSSEDDQEDAPLARRASLAAVQKRKEATKRRYAEEWENANNVEVAPALRRHPCRHPSRHPSLASRSR